MIATIADGNEIAILAAENEFRFAIAVHIGADDTVRGGRELEFPKMLSGADVKTDQRAIGFHLAATPPADFGWRQEALVEAGVAGAHRPAFGGEVLVPKTTFA